MRPFLDAAPVSVDRLQELEEEHADVSTAHPYMHLHSAHSAGVYHMRLQPVLSTARLYLFIQRVYSSVIFIRVPRLVSSQAEDELVDAKAGVTKAANKLKRKPSDEQLIQQETGSNSTPCWQTHKMHCDA